MYINIPKPTGTPYTNVGKPSNGGTMASAGMTMGLLIPLTVARNQTASSPYTNVSKPTGTPYTNISKPT